MRRMLAAAGVVVALAGVLSGCGWSGGDPVRMMDAHESALPAEASKCQVARFYDNLVQNATVVLADGIGELSGASWKMTGPYGPDLPTAYAVPTGSEVFQIEQSASFGRGSLAAAGDPDREEAVLDIVSVLESEGFALLSRTDSAEGRTVIKAADESLWALVIFEDNGSLGLHVTLNGTSASWGERAPTFSMYDASRRDAACQVPGMTVLPGVQGASLGAASATPDPSATPGPSATP